jgi:chromate transporter
LKPHDQNIRELAKLFLKLGVIGFGGPAVHIAMMEEEVVRKRKWMDHDHFLDLVGATNLIPGPNSTEMTMHIGNERAGWKGLVTAGTCFIVPAVIITAFLAWLYTKFGTLPAVQPYIYGIKPAIVAVIIVTMILLGKKAVKTTALGIFGVLAFLAVIIGINEIIVLFGCGCLGIAIHLIKKQAQKTISLLPFTFFKIFTPSTAALKVLLIFLKVGSILYGSGYVLFAFLDAELVAKGLITKQQLIDAIAVGQITPGPVFSSATFVGWQMNGWTGAVAATIGIFLPSFLFVAFLNPWIPRLRGSQVMSAFLDAVNVASVGIMLAVISEMASETIIDWRTAVIAIAGLISTFLFKKLNTAFIVIGGAFLGYCLYYI